MDLDEILEWFSIKGLGDESEGRKKVKAISLDS